jgi:hypothetical protein
MARRDPIRRCQPGPRRNDLLRSEASPVSGAAGVPANNTAEA